ncbi:BlaI/MecI/CopY family transcriptional regulator [Anaerosporobacter sp.]
MKYQLGDVESKFAEIIWSNEPISSGELVKLCEKEMSWKKSTVYTVLKKLCNRGIFQNKNSIVTSILSKEELDRRKGKEFVDESFGGSLPRFLAAFMENQKLNKQQIDEIKKTIEQYEED